MRGLRWLPAALVTVVARAHAQTPAPGPSPDAPPAPAAPSNNANSGSTTTTTTVYRALGLPAPGTDINAGLPSSSRPVNNDQSD
ncbi:MAG TPA: hypothetical protein VMF89_24425, partial [Polyangiales bacterium]|nr:hypothetical protein [Polyangiales bacterium]